MKEALTFGLEVEFFAAIKASTFTRSLNHENIASLLAGRLRRMPLHGPEGRGIEVKVVSDSEFDADEERMVDYSCWNLTTDFLVEAMRPEWFSTYETQPIEIISPPYWIHSNWEFDIQRIFSSRVGQFNPISASELRLYYELNHSTSFHIHIGNGIEPEAAFSFETIRNLAMIILVYEPELDKLFDSQIYSTHPGVARISTYEHQHRCLSLTESPYFQPPFLPHHASRPVLAFHLLRSCTDIESIVAMMCPPESLESEQDPPGCNRYWKYNFAPLLDPNEGTSTSTGRRKAPTVEFRLQIGTLDPDTMIHWVRFLAALVTFASRFSTQAAIEFLGLDTIDDSMLEVDDDTSDSESSTPATAPTAGSSSPSPSDSKPSTSVSGSITPTSTDTGTPAAASVSDRGSPPVRATTAGESSNLFSSLNILSSLHPVGSIGRLVTTMESLNVPLDEGTMRFWRRRIMPSTFGRR